MSSQAGPLLSLQPADRPASQLARRLVARSGGCARRPFGGRKATLANALANALAHDQPPECDQSSIICRDEQLARHRSWRRAARARARR